MNINYLLYATKELIILFLGFLFAIALSKTIKLKSSWSIMLLLLGVFLSQEQIGRAYMTINCVVANSYILYFVDNNRDRLNMSVLWCDPIMETPNSLYVFHSGDRWLFGFGAILFRAFAYTVIMLLLQQCIGFITSKQPVKSMYQVAIAMSVSVTLMHDLLRLLSMLMQSNWGGLVGLIILILIIGMFSSGGTPLYWVVIIFKR